MGRRRAGGTDWSAFYIPQRTRPGRRRVAALAVSGVALRDGDGNQAHGRSRYVNVPAQGPPVEGLRGDAACADQGRRPRRARRSGRPLAVQRRRGSASVNGSTSDGRAGTDDAPVGRWTATATPWSYTFTIEQIGGAGMVVPGFGFLVNNELTDFNFDSIGHGEPGRGREAAAQSSMSPTIVAEARQAVPRARLTRRRDDHHDRPANAREPARLRDDAAGRARGAARQPAELELDASGTGLHQHVGHFLGARGHTFSSTPEIGAATGIEFIGGGKVVAAADPVLRGVGSALVDRRRRRSSRVVFAAAGRVGAHPARSIAGVAVVAYASGLVAPGVIGGIASASSLTTAFCVVAALVGIIALAAGVLRRGG